MITKEVFEEQKALSDRWKEMYYEKKNELDQLTNNWNELEEWVKSEYNRYYNDTENLVLSNVETMDYSRMLDKMKEIKEKNGSR